MVSDLRQRSKSDHGTDGPPVFRLDMLGPTQLVNVSTQETIDFQSRKAMCLLALLVMTPDRTMSREKLASFLWDPAPEEQARGSLRQCLKRMRLALGDEADRILEIGRSDVRLIAGNFESDLWLLTDIVKSGTSDKSAVLEAVNLWRGDILANGVPKAPIFEASLQVERSRLKTMLTSWLADWLQAHFAEFDQESRKIAQELLRIEPSHELAHQHLIYHFAVNGNQAAAIRQFNELESALAEELDSVPSDELVDLLVKVKSGELAGSHERQVQTGPVPSTNRHRKLGIPRIAVRPPLGRVLDEDLNYLADGFADLLVSCLSKFKCWVVLVWPSKGFPAQGRIDYQALAQSTGADYVVDAVLDWRQSPGRLHVSLIDCEAEENVWTETLTAEPHELHALSNSVAGKISSRLASQINHIASLRFERSVAGNASAYDSWLRGHQLTRLWDKSADRQALALFEEAIAQDPGLSCAYASMAAVYNTRIMVRPGEFGRSRRPRACPFALPKGAVARSARFTEPRQHGMVAAVDARVRTGCNAFQARSRSQPL